MRNGIGVSHVLLIALVAGHAQAQSYDAFKQFSIKNNPSGTWSYVANGALLTEKFKACNGIQKDYCWTNDGSGNPNVAADEANKTNTTIKYADVVLPPKYLDFDPENTGNVAFVWTAPAAGTIRVEGNFLGVATDEGVHTVDVLRNGVSLRNYTISSYGQKVHFSFTSPVSPGSTISFVSNSGNSGNALSTGLQAKIVYK